MYFWGIFGKSAQNETLIANIALEIGGCTLAVPAYVLDTLPGVRIYNMIFTKTIFHLFYNLYIKSILYEKLLSILKQILIEWIEGATRD